jgi:hypothetical protein
MANYAQNLQWYKDTTLLLNQTSQSLLLDQPGEYWVEYTSPDGCKSQSEEVAVAFIPNPAAPAFHAEGNLLVLNNPDFLPNEYSLQWYVDGVLQPGATDVEFCITQPGTSLYTLAVVDGATGCSSEFSLGASFDPSVDCTTASGEVAAWGQHLRIFPNPFGDFVNLVFENDKDQAFKLGLYDGTGRLIMQKNLEAPVGEVRETLDASGLPAGIYFVKIQGQAGFFSQKLLKK